MSGTVNLSIFARRISNGELTSGLSRVNKLRECSIRPSTARSTDVRLRLDRTLH